MLPPKKRVCSSSSWALRLLEGAAPGDRPSGPARAAVSQPPASGFLRTLLALLAGGACPSPATAGTCSTTIRVLPAGEVEPQLHCQTAFRANRESCPPLVTNFQVKLESLSGVPSTNSFAILGRKQDDHPQPCGGPAFGTGVSETQQEGSIM